MHLATAAPHDHWRTTACLAAPRGTGLAAHTMAGVAKPIRPVSASTLHLPFPQPFHLLRGQKLGCAAARTREAP